ncbi:hypothetical protein [Catalinimonas locisalis]|uniref:hypothetical protein n=1 Tax=Catalinimonas locisalis TaxID=3133978 RepID=UPI0031014F3C
MVKMPDGMTCGVNIGGGRVEGKEETIKKPQAHAYGLSFSAYNFAALQSSILFGSNRRSGLF